MNEINLTIDRIVINAPGEALDGERLRGRIESALQQMMAGASWSDPINDAAAAKINVQAIPASPGGDGIARAVSQGIAQALERLG